ncbi:MAG: ELM1/GtrOC1 family putative glycosyltransferase, partial [Candidatus Wallbacteria bacterium]|nr:ELM1/GtrOC1 family putative glycosyltransferase [Candidatus Wallbacteria bacterium]
VSAGMEVLMTTSRRTPPDVGNALKQMATHPAFCLAVFVDEQQYNPLPGMLAWTNSVVVTEDSFSMISEAVSSGRSTGVLISGKRENDKIRRSLKLMSDRGMIFPIRSVADANKFIGWRLLRHPKEELDRLMENLILCIGTEADGGA